MKEENGLLKIGVSEFAIDQLGDIVFVELVEKGCSLQKGETFGTIESVKAVEEVYLPFSGEVISVNEGVIDNPEILQNDPIGEGWLVIIKPQSNFLLSELMNSIIRDRSTGCFIIGPKNITAKINETFLVKLSTAIAHLIGVPNHDAMAGKYYARFHVKHEDSSDSYLRKAYRNMDLHTDAVSYTHLTLPTKRIV